MTFCPSASFRLNAVESPTARIAIGMAASNTCPIFRPEYAAAAEKSIAIRSPHITDHGVTSAGDDSGGISGRYSSPGFQFLVGVFG